MATNRRQFIQLLMAGVITPQSLQTIAGTLTQQVKEVSPLIISCRTDQLNQHFATVASLNGNIIADIQLPDRGHGISCSNDKKQAAIFARRPGKYLWIMDLQTYQLRHKLHSLQDYHYYGHGVYSDNGNYLFCSENNFKKQQSVIGVYEVNADYKRVSEIPSYGIGVHELHFLSDQQTLVIANGGILTHPDFQRKKLNINTMKPNLSYIDTLSGKLLGQFHPHSKWHQLSIRHIDVSADDSVAIAMQFQGKKNKQPPLVAVHKGEDELQFFHAEPKTQKQMRNYCGSVLFYNDKQFAVSSPRGNLITFWDCDNGYISNKLQADVCGLAHYKQQMYSSDGNGLVLSTDISRQKNSSRHFYKNSRWDNHLLII